MLAVPAIAPCTDAARLFADYPRRTSFQVQANATDENYLSGQYSTVVDPGSSLASFSGLLLHASNGSYDIKFQAINHAVSAAPTVC